MAMTNAQIIFFESCKLMDAGIIGTTGRSVRIRNADGSETDYMEPEEIHTFAAWKSLGFSVKKGAHAVAKFPIWKYTKQTVKDDNGDDQETSRMFLKTAAFFTFGQVEPMNPKKTA